VRSRNWLALAATGALAIGVAACGSSSKSGGSTGSGASISGAGATFPQPVYDEWANRFKSKDGIAVNYNPIGSGGGIAQFTAGTVDFGASDSAMKPEEVKAAEKKGTPVHVPTVFGAIDPGLQAKVFASDITPYIGVTANLGLIFYMFLIGLEVDFSQIRGRVATTLAVSNTGLAVPMMLGMASAIPMKPAILT